MVWNGCECALTTDSVKYFFNLLHTTIDNEIIIYQANSRLVAFLDKKMLSINDYVREYAEKGAESDSVIISDEDVQVVSDDAKSEDVNNRENNSDNNDKKRWKWRKS